MEQIAFFPFEGEDVDDLVRQVKAFDEYAKKKRKWENAFQKWSNDQWQDDTSPLGKCGYGFICDYCEDNSYGRPCVRALNAMCREKRITIDYSNRNFERIWERGSNATLLQQDR